MSGTGEVSHGAPLGISCDVAGTNEDLPGHQVWDEGARIVPEVASAAHEVVLMTAEAVALGVEVVLQQVDPPGDACSGQPGVGLLGKISHDQLAGAVLSEQILKAIALGGGELRV